MVDTDTEFEVGRTNPLVSIITPCYNGAKYLEAFLLSVASQTYRPIELVFVDDGSTDETKAVLMGLLSTLLDSGIEVVYTFQENSGQAAAINRGLQQFNGSYIMWCDADDILLENNIEVKVRYLEEHPRIGFVLSKAYVVNHDNVDMIDQVVGRSGDIALDNEVLFSDYLQSNNVIFGPGVILVRKNALYDAIPSMHICESREGQNWQLMLPLAYRVKYGLLETPLMKYVKHDDSHSHTKRSYREEILRIDGFLRIVADTLESMPYLEAEEREKWETIAKIRFTEDKLHHACNYLRIGEALRYKRELSALRPVGLNDSVIVYEVKRLLHKLRFV